MPETTHIATGEYPKPRPVHHLDLEAEADKLLTKLAGSRRQSESLARESGVSVIMMAMEGGDVLREHSADGVVMVQLFRGHAVLTSNKQSIDLREGHVVVFQPGVLHDLSAEEQSVIVLTVTGGNE